MTSGNSKISLDHVDSKFGISIHLTEEFQKFRKNICCVFTMQVHIVFVASNYNSHCLLAEVMVHQGKDYLIRKKQTIQDILGNQEIIDFSEVTKNTKEAIPA